jgi:hypothetical protein
MNKNDYLKYSNALNGFDYYLKGRRIYRFELFLKGHNVDSLQNGTARNITKRKRINEPTY